MRTQTQEQVASYAHTAETQVAEHPWLAIAGGFGSGVALGIARPSGNGHKAASSDGSKSDYGGESLLSKGVSALLSATGGPVLDEVRGTLQETLSDLKSTLQASVSDVVHGISGTGANGNGSNASQHRQRVRDHAA